MSASCPAQWVPMDAKSKIKITFLSQSLTSPTPRSPSGPRLAHPRNPKMQWKLPASAAVVV
ncbi:hypothetical protein E2C01_007268 [Portunus trituberculatus]|uniref:Uncharacterized protein n=1 Tax=Portunus trituberculatus TaxID=210409 RepID=A0A5B7D030_PORTR|nr:hypothetical protein [Portunus trituberculatus]